MGRPPPDPSGDECAWAIPHWWASGETPRFITAQANDLEECPGAHDPPPSDSYVLQQTDAAACIWMYRDDVYWWTFTILPAECKLIIVHDPNPARFFFSAVGQPLGTISFDNQLTVCSPSAVQSKNGTVDLFL